MCLERIWRIECFWAYRHRPLMLGVVNVGRCIIETEDTLTRQVWRDVGKQGRRKRYCESDDPRQMKCQPKWFSTNICQIIQQTAGRAHKNNNSRTSDEKQLKFLFRCASISCTDHRDHHWAIFCLRVNTILHDILGFDTIITRYLRYFPFGKICA